MRRVAASMLAWWLALASAQGAAGRLEVLAPRDGFRAPSSGAWLVVRAAAAPRVTLDGQPLSGAAPEEGVYHLRVGPLRPEGSRLQVESAGRRVALTLYGVAGARGGGFHAVPPGGCWSCHESGRKGCAQCHRWPGVLHAPARKGECDACHDPKRPPLGVPALCRRCHPKQAGGRHPGLRHPTSAPQDPARPGRPFDCTSCHDPHAPAPLGRLNPQERQRWCKGCHRR